MPWSVPAVATHLPWIAGLFVAPFWFGGVGDSCQVAAAMLIALSLLLNFSQVRSTPESLLGRIALGGIVAIAVLSLLPIKRELSASPDFALMAGESMGLSFAPGATLLRLWQLGMAAACFALARQVVRVSGFLKVVAVGMALGVLLLAAAELWRIYDGHGVWNEPRHYPGGTFANRNHFASWMVAGAMFCFGALLRKARKIRDGQRTGADLFEVALYGIAVVVGIGMVLSSGSRGGALALAAGLVAWALLLWLRKSHGIALGMFGGLLVCAVAVFAFTGEATMARLSGGDIDFKLRIWREALDLFAKWPLLGIGLGAFADVFSVFKTFHGEGSILFVENEYLQWVVEMGAVGAVLAMILFVVAGLALWKGVRAGHFSRSDLFCGALAALAALLAHGLFEFVFHVPSILLMGAVLLGIAVGLAQSATRTVEPLALRRDFVGNAVIILFIGGLVVQQARAMAYGGADTDASRVEAAELWPLDPHKTIEAVRKVVATSPNASTNEYKHSKALLTRALAWRPYHWELRLERAWLDLAFAENIQDALTEARRAIALNPLQSKIPLRFAAVLAARHPAHALDFLRSAPVAKYEDAREALRIGWSISRDAALLWELTPVTTEGLRALAQFAREQNLNAVAEEAERQLRGTNGNHD